MPTPSYLGTGQPPADNGGNWFGQLGSLFGRGNTPAYAGDGQPSASGASVLGAAVPAYAPAPVRQRRRAAQACSERQCRRTRLHPFASLCRSQRMMVQTKPWTHVRR
jgi:hypothetical protein